MTTPQSLRLAMAPLVCCLTLTVFGPAMAAPSKKTPPAPPIVETAAPKPGFLQKLNPFRKKTPPPAPVAPPTAAPNNSKKSKAAPPKPVPPPPPAAAPKRKPAPLAAPAAPEPEPPKNSTSSPASKPNWTATPTPCPTPPSPTVLTTGRNAGSSPRTAPPFLNTAPARPADRTFDSPRAGSSA